MLTKKRYQCIRTGLFAFVKYRIHLSIIFALLLYGNNIKLGVPVDYNLLFSFVLWHFSLFLFDRIYDRKIDMQSQPDEYVKDDFAGALKKYQEATTVASKPCYRQYYCKLEAFLALSLTLEKMGDLRGAIEAFREVSKLLSEDFEPNIRVTELLVVSMHNLIFDALMLCE